MGTPAGEPSRIGESCGLVITMLPDSAAVRSAVLGDGGQGDGGQGGIAQGLIDRHVVDPARSIVELRA